MVEKFLVGMMALPQNAQALPDGCGKGRWYACVQLPSVQLAVRNRSVVASCAKGRSLVLQRNSMLASCRL